jgi:AraC-like DNA-binding protein
MPTPWRAPNAAITLLLLESVMRAAQATGAVGKAEGAAWLAEVRRLSGASSGMDRVPLLHLVDLWRLVVANVPDHAVGARMADHAALEDFGVVGALISRAPDLATAFEHCTQYARIVRQGIGIRVQREGPDLVMTYRPDDARTARPRAAERRAIDAGLMWIMANLASIPERAFGSALRPRRVELRCAQPRSWVDLGRIFGGDVVFDAPDNTLVWRWADVQQVRRDVPQRGDFLVDLARNELHRVPELGDLSGQVAALLRDHLTDPSYGLEQVAGALALSPRTLQRRLKLEDTSFARLHDEQRRERAARLVAQGASGAAIAQQLGYADPTIASRSLKRWFGPGRGR